MNDLWGWSATDLLAVGTSGTSIQYPRCWHYDGAGWVEVPVADAGASGLSTMWGFASGEAVAAASDEVLGSAEVFLFSEGAFGQATGALSSPLDFVVKDLWGSTLDDLYAVGARDTEDGPFVVAHFDGNSWEETEIPGAGSLNAIGGDGVSGAFSVGDGGVIFHWDGSVWQEMDSGTENDLIRVWASGPEEVFAVGRSCTVLRFDGSAWSAMTADCEHKDFTSLWGDGNGTVFAAAYSSGSGLSANKGRVFRYVAH